MPSTIPKMVEQEGHIYVFNKKIAFLINIKINGSPMYLDI